MKNTEKLWDSIEVLALLIFASAMLAAFLGSLFDLRTMIP